MSKPATLTQRLEKVEGDLACVAYLHAELVYGMKLQVANQLALKILADAGLVGGGEPTPAQQQMIAKAVERIMEKMAEGHTPPIITAPNPLLPIT